MINLNELRVLFEDFGEVVFDGEPGLRFEIAEKDSFFLCAKTQEKSCCQCPFLASDECRRLTCHVKNDNNVKFKEFKRI
jgi:hypothetical protein